jgi:hypothetical protein
MDFVSRGSIMRSQFPGKNASPTSGDGKNHWYAGHGEEQFVYSKNDGWYVESREGEFGPFKSLQDVEEFYYKRFEF